MESQQQEIPLEEVVKALTFQMEAIISLLERKNIATREEILGEILRMKNVLN